MERLQQLFILLDDNGLLDYYCDLFASKGKTLSLSSPTRKECEQAILSFFAELNMEEFAGHMADVTANIDYLNKQKMADI